MYIAGSGSYTDILVGTSDFYDMLMRIELIKRVANYDNDMIDGLIALKDQYESEQEELNAQKAELEADLDSLSERREKQQAQMTKLEGLYSESEKSLEELEEDRKLYEDNLEELEKEQEEFEESLQKLYEEQEAIKKKEEEEAAKKAKEEEERKKKEAEEAERKKQEEAAKQQNSSTDSDSSDNTDKTDTGSTDSNTNSDTNSNTDNNQGGGNTNSDYGYVDKSRFTWPVPGYYHISYGVGWRWGAYHKGIDIYSANIRGANIIAADAGTVILVSNTCTHDYGKNYSCGCGGGYGNYCIIDHGDGYWTLYGHSEGITVKQGQTVKKGTVLGTVGSTGHSTGPHLHFEVRKDGVAQNPSNYV
jgi:murein DD-endopeptidase MepM/ murein hydrolase activator NlpD